MPISISDLRAAASRGYQTRRYKSLNEATANGKQSAFLCHSHKDKELAEGLAVLLAENGWELYVDWKDHEMPEKPDKATATKIKSKIASLEWFLFLATPSSSASRWCPWEIGIADSKKPNGSILIIPTTDNSGNWYGNEYLQLYSQIIYTTTAELARFSPGSTTGGTLLRNIR